MATLITRAELEERVREMQDALDKMIDPKHLVCPACMGLFHADTRTAGDCWCDYESDWQEE